MTAAAEDPPPRPRRGYLGPGLIALTALAVLGLVLGFGFLNSYTPTTLAGPVVADQLATSIQINARHGQADPPTVRCPAEEPERVGLVFDCRLQRRSGSPETIRVTETSARGSYRYEVVPSG